MKAQYIKTSVMQLKQIFRGKCMTSNSYIQKNNTVKVEDPSFHFGSENKENQIKLG